MRLFIVILILCLTQFRVQASDWLNRTVRVDLIVNRNGRAYDPQYDTLAPSKELLSGVSATNGQYPWNTFTVAWTDFPEGGRFGRICLSTIISDNFFLTDGYCVGQDLIPAATSIEIFYGSVQLLNSGLIPTNFARHYWYIGPSPESGPRIVLSRFHETVKFNPNIQPIRLPSPENFSYEEWSSYLLGMDFFSDPRSDLTSTHASISRSNSLCKDPGIVNDYEICATDGSQLFNGGSPGGAWIVYEYTAGFEFIPVVIGIHGSPSQFFSISTGTRVSHFVEWIETLQEEN